MKNTPHFHTTLEVVRSVATVLTVCLQVIILVKVF